MREKRKTKLNNILISLNKSPEEIISAGNEPLTLREDPEPWNAMIRYYGKRGDLESMKKV